MAHYFTEDILREILVTLPVKSLVRFTFVNKSWWSIIESPSFVSAHLTCTSSSDSNNTDRLLLLTLSATEEAHMGIVTACLGKQAIEQDHHNTELMTRLPHKVWESFGVVGSCNGLVLLRDHINTLILWNPSIRKIVTLPTPQYTKSKYEFGVLASIGWGFGFDSRTNDYKVVNNYRVKIKGNMKFDSHLRVFSLTTGYWKSIRVGDHPVCRFVQHGGQAFFINGAIHWIGTRTDVYQNMALSFDVSNEIFREIMLPKKEIADFLSTESCPSQYMKSRLLCVMVEIHLILCVGDERIWGSRVMDQSFNFP